MSDVQTITGGGLVKNPLATQAGLAPWLRQLTGAVTPLTHPNPPAAPWYTDAMNAKQATQADMVRQWHAQQDALAKAAADAAEQDRLLHAGDDNRSGWVRFRDGRDGPANLAPSALQGAIDPGGGAVSAVLRHAGFK